MNAMSNSEIIKESARQLDLYTQHLPVDQLIDELQLIIDRLNFSGYLMNDRNVDGYISRIDLMFDGDISDSIRGFVHWLYDNHMLDVLSGELGCSFLDYCIKAYSDIVEVKFITPIALDVECREVVINKLRSLYPGSSKIVCEVVPGLKAGFVISDGKSIIDRSLKTAMPKIIRSFIRRSVKRNKIYG